MQENTQMAVYGGAAGCRNARSAASSVYAAGQRAEERMNRAASRYSCAQASCKREEQALRCMRNRGFALGAGIGVLGLCGPILLEMASAKLVAVCVAVLCALLICAIACIDEQLLRIKACKAALASAEDDLQAAMVAADCSARRDAFPSHRMESYE